MIYPPKRGLAASNEVPSDTVPQKPPLPGGQSKVPTPPPRASEPPPLPAPRIIPEDQAILQAPPVASEQARLFPVWGLALPGWFPPWLVMILAPLAGVGLAVGVMLLLRPFSAVPEPETSEPTQPVQTSELPPQKVGPSEPSVSAAKPSEPKTLDKQWIPDPTCLVAAVRYSRLQTQGQVRTALESCWPEAAQVGHQLVRHFRLSPDKVEHLIWFAVEGKDWPGQSVILVCLAEGTGVEELAQRGRVCDFGVGNVPCRVEPDSPWPHPFAVISSRWILTGPEVLLRHLAGRPKPQLQSRALDRMIAAWPWEADLTGFVDSQLVRSTAGGEISRLIEVWPESRRAAKVLWEVPEGVCALVHFGTPVRVETSLLCATASEAEQVHSAVEELLGAGDSALGQRLERLGQQVQAGQWKADRAAEYEKFLKGVQAGVQSARLETAETSVWLRTVWKGSVEELVQKRQTVQEALRSDWTESASQVVQEQQHRLLQALQAYTKAEGHFPPGAEGGPLWNPETRLSWIALLLPYLGQADWYQQLQPRYPWNSPQNKSVARRPLETVLNPMIEQRGTEAGFPVTHYVGVAGIGEDAAQPKADPRRIGVFGFGRTLKPEEITDGLSHTIAIAGVQDRLGPWASGGSATVRAFTQAPYVNGPDGFGTGHAHGMFVGMADGSVRFVSKNVDPRVLEMLATAKGMEKIEGFAWEPGPKPIQPGTAGSGLSRPVGVGKTIAGPKPSEGPAIPPSEPKPGAPGPSEKPEPLVEKGKPAPASLPEQQAETEARLAEKIASIEVPGLPLRKAVGLIEALSAVRITYDLDELEVAGVSLDAPVRFKRTDTTVGEILQTILEPFALVWVIEGKDVLITRPTSARQELHTVRYEVADLDAGQESQPEDLAQLLERFVMPESWQTSGGPGKIEVRDDVLVVHQTELVHRRVVELLEKLRLARGLPPRMESGRKGLQLQTRQERMGPKLKQVITANFTSPTPLPEILAYLEQLADVTIVVDWVALRAEGHEPPVQTTLRVHQQSFADTLKSLLEPLGLTYRIAGPELLQITTQKSAAMRLEVEFYPASEAISSVGSVKALLEAVKEQVGRGTWEDTQGPGCIYFDPPSKYLVVLQSPAVHADLQRFLTQVQAAKPAPK